MPPDLAGDIAGAGGGGGSVAKGYYGHCIAAVTWSSLVWTGIHNALTFVDDVQEGVTRVNSDFTFAIPGLYKFDLRAGAYNTAGNDFLLFRGRRAGATVLVGVPGYTENTTGADRYIIVPMHGLLRVNAADVVTLEYAVSAAWNAFAGVAVDGTDGQTASLTIVREGA